jgi:hypothetical protein
LKFDYKIQFDLIMSNEKYPLHFEDDALVSFINPGLDPLEFEIDSLSYDARIVFSILARNILDKNQVIATSVLDLIDDKMRLRSGNFKLFMWLNSKVDETQQYHSYGRDFAGWVNQRDPQGRLLQTVE